MAGTLQQPENGDNLRHSAKGEDPITTEQNLYHVALRDWYLGAADNDQPVATAALADAFRRLINMITDIELAETYAWLDDHFGPLKNGYMRARAAYDAPWDPNDTSLN